MTESEAVEILIAGGDTYRGRLLLAVTESFLRDASQVPAAGWCLSASNENILAVWRRAVAVLRLPDDIREAAELN